MRNITTLITTAFLNRQPKNLDNTCSDGTRLTLHGNVIAEFRDDELWVTTAGWNTVTTRERLNGLPLNLSMKSRRLFLNGTEWDGQWICVQETPKTKIKKVKTNLYLMEFFEHKSLTSSLTGGGYYLRSAWVNASSEDNAKLKLELSHKLFSSVVSCEEKLCITPLLSDSKPLILD